MSETSDWSDPQWDASRTAEELRTSVRGARTALTDLTEDAARKVPTAGGWSAQQVVGHLIDSAINNIPRFVSARDSKELVFPGYDQEAWVSHQRYEERDFGDLLSLWVSLNDHMAVIVETTPEDDWSRDRWSHNLHRIAWRVVPRDQAATLGYFMRDYVGHLRHHLKQIDRALQDS